MTDEMLEILSLGVVTGFSISKVGDRVRMIVNYDVTAKPGLFWRTFTGDTMEQVWKLYLGFHPEDKTDNFQEAIRRRQIQTPNLNKFLNRLGVL